MPSLSLGAYAQEGLAELSEDPLLFMAAVLLVTVSIMWIVVARLITKNLRRAALRRMGRRRRPKRPTREMWDNPP